MGLRSGGGGGCGGAGSTWPASLLSAAALCCLAFGLQEGGNYRWGAGGWALPAAGSALGAVFVLYRRRR
ncbi:hypothetical protein ACFZDJ_28910 [Streptomyces sp. NPDC007896]|uniref:hypothetical protein n=1 Tax=Streptomyces sp. NPDC007896 TaxID=3364784 RepID=UPI0036EC6835